MNMENGKSKDNRLVIIVKIEKYIEYMLTILLKFPRTEKFSKWRVHIFKFFIIHYIKLQVHIMILLSG